MAYEGESSALSASGMRDILVSEESTSPSPDVSGQSRGCRCWRPICSASSSLHAGGAKWRKGWKSVDGRGERAQTPQVGSRRPRRLVMPEGKTA